MANFSQISANRQDVQSFVQKLTQFSQSLEPAERSLLIDCIRHSLPNSDQGTTTREASLELFAAWVNSILTDGSRWYPS